MSWVFLTDTHAYKLKKPVRYAYLDFSTIEARRLDCEQELLLNRRLAADVYLGVIPLVLGAEGRLGVGGAGEVVDWLVQMRRLPAQRMLDYLIRNGTVEPAEISRLARRLARFYAHGRLKPSRPRRIGSTWPSAIEANLRELTSPEFGLDKDLPERLARFQLGFLETHAELFDSRVRQGRIVEGHGDLRPEHVCLLPEPVVIDCLEFNREYRILDPADELGYLALECERLHAPQVGRWLLESYTRSEWRRAARRPAPFLPELAGGAACHARHLAPARRRAASARKSGWKPPGNTWNWRSGMPPRQEADARQPASSSTSDPPLCRRRMASANSGADSSTSTRLPTSAGGSRKGGMVSVTSTFSRAGSASTCARRADEHAVAGGGVHPVRAQRLAGGGGPRQGGAGADQVVDDEGGLAADLAHHRLAGNHAFAAALLHEGGRRRAGRAHGPGPGGRLPPASPRRRPATPPRRVRPAAVPRTRPRTGRGLPGARPGCGRHSGRRPGCARPGSPPGPCPPPRTAGRHSGC